MKVLFTLTLILFLSMLVPGQEKLKHAVDLYRSANYAGAVAELEKLNSSGSGNHQSFLYLGVAYARLGRDKEAREAFAQAGNLAVMKNIEGETPLKIIKKKPPTSKGVPDSFQTGSTVLAVEFLPDKTIGFIFVVRTTTDEFIKNCTQAARKIKFEPATSNGSPVAVVKLVEYTFERF